MFNSTPIPDAWRTHGIEYVVDIGDNQEIWRRYCQLQDELSAARTKPDDSHPRIESELRAMEPEIADLFTCTILPYSADEYRALESAARSKGISVRVDPKKQTATIDGDPMAIGEQTALEVVRRRVLAVKGYFVTFLELGPNGLPCYEHGEYKIRERRAITTGAELVDHITRFAWESERAIIDDLMQAIRDRSHLARGEKKTFCTPPSS